MGIDRIGKAGGPAVPGPVAPGGAGRVGEPFSVRESAAAASTAAVSGPLEQLRSGAIDVAQYMELKVTEATVHLAALPAAELEGIRASLRERLASDPALVQLREVAERAAAQLVPNDPKE
jgi:hypothetical protein